MIRNKKTEAAKTKITGMCKNYDCTAATKEGPQGSGHNCEWEWP